MSFEFLNIDFIEARLQTNSLVLFSNILWLKYVVCFILMMVQKHIF